MVPACLPQSTAPKFPRRPRASGGRGRARTSVCGSASPTCSPSPEACSWPIAALSGRLAFFPPRLPLPHPSSSLLSPPLRCSAPGARASRSAERRGQRQRRAPGSPRALPAPGCSRPRSSGSSREEASGVFLELHLEGSRWGRRRSKASYGPCESGKTQLGRAAGPGDPEAPETGHSPCLMLCLSLSRLIRP